jgi:uncharacterized protein YndB with AHSA1/START domain
MKTIAQVSTRIAASPADVWNALTTPETIKKYFFGAEVESDWEEGNPIYFRGDYQGKSYEDKGEILTFEPEKRLSFSHWSPLSGVADRPENYHLVIFDLARDGKDTEVTLTQAKAGEVKKSDLEKKEEFEKNWRMVLEGLKKTVEH